MKKQKILMEKPNKFPVNIKIFIEFHSDFLTCSYSKSDINQWSYILIQVFWTQALFVCHNIKIGEYKRIQEDFMFFFFFMFIDVFLMLCVVPPTSLKRCLLLWYIICVTKTLFFFFFCGILTKGTIDMLNIFVYSSCFYYFTVS